MREDVRRYALQQIRREARRVSGRALRRLNCPQRHDIAAVREGRKRQRREILLQALVLVAVLNVVAENVVRLAQNVKALGGHIGHNARR